MNHIERGRFHEEDDSGDIIINEPEPEKIQFVGQDAEVTVQRSSGKLEGGWLVVRPDDKKDGYVVVRKSENGRNIEKVLSQDKLSRLQPFREGENVPVIRSDGQLDAEGWKVEKSSGSGSYMLSKDIDGQRKRKILDKAGLIRAKIAELDLERRKILDWEDSHVDDRKLVEKIDQEADYWQGKLEALKDLSDAA